MAGKAGAAMRKWDKDNIIVAKECDSDDSDSDSDSDARRRRRWCISSTFIKEFETFSGTKSKELFKYLRDNGVDSGQDYKGYYIKSDPAKKIEATQMIIALTRKPLHIIEETLSK